ncbi:MAG: stage II sporulation protein R [Clostridia bacterium]|nr:stage II sporulation protein R [Clostridia bacterium]MBQ9847545.1 stage II sporulation protein R [Clostridia bacterium]
MKTKLIALFCASFLLLTVVDMFIPRSEAKIFENVIRLHILADDNSEAAQSVKLLVRDAVLEECGDLFGESGNITAARATLESSIPKMQSVANRVLAENGVDYCATVEWGTEEYPVRVYDDFSLPAGEYLSLRLKLGSGSGNNWWCVLFPPLCTGASSDNSFEKAGISERDSQVFTKPKYIFRFKLLELFGW